MGVVGVTEKAIMRVSEGSLGNGWQIARRGEQNYSPQIDIFTVFSIAQVFRLELFSGVYSSSQRWVLTD